jgi:glycosyltransferase involved in cell wall biosynthesis
MQKVLYLLHNFHNRAGTEEHAKVLGEAIAKSYEVAYLFPQGDTLVLRKEADGSEEIFPGKQMPWPLPPLKDETISGSLQQIFTGFKPDIIHIQHIFNWPLGIIEELAPVAPLVMSYHEYFSITPFFTMAGTENPEVGLSEDYVKKIFGADIRPQLFQRIKFLQQSFSKLASRVVPSVFLASVLGRLYPANYTVIPHGIKPFATTPYQGEKLRFGYMGTLIPQKGWQQLLKAWPLLFEKYPEKIELHLYGGGDPGGALPPGVTHRGVYDQPDIPRILSDFHISVIPSIFAETFSLVLSEVQQAGLPAATSGMGVFRERIRPGQNGYLFNPFNIQEIADTLERFVTDSSWREWQIEKPRLVEEMRADYAGLYRSVIGG